MFTNQYIILQMKAKMDNISITMLLKKVTFSKVVDFLKFANTQWSKATRKFMKMRHKRWTRMSRNEKGSRQSSTTWDPEVNLKNPVQSCSYIGI